MLVAAVTGTPLVEAKEVVELERIGPAVVVLDAPRRTECRVRVLRRDGHVIIGVCVRDKNRCLGEGLYDLGAFSGLHAAVAVIGKDHGANELCDRDDRHRGKWEFQILKSGFGHGWPALS